MTLTGSGDTALMESVEYGPVAAAAGTLTSIVTPTAGWTGVTNAAAAVLGRLDETDAAFRTRYMALTSRLAAGYPAAIRSRILEVPGVTRAFVHNNDTGADLTEQGLTIPARGILAIVQGGADAAVAAAIAAAKTGSATGGAVTVSGISFERVTETAVAIAVNTAIRADFPADGIADMRSAIEAYAVANWEVGVAIDVRALIAPAYSVAGHVLNNDPVATLQAGGNLPTMPNLNVLYTLAASNVTITTTI